VAVVAAFYALFVPARIHHFGVEWFIHLGHRYETAAHTSSKIGPQLGWQSRVGYDGQYYFGLAVDPVHAHDYMGHLAPYVYGRPFYPLVAGVLGGGSVRVVPYTMLIVNLVAVLAGTLALALWLRGRGASPWWAALFGLYPGLVYTVFRDLTEPLAFALVVLAALALQRRRTWLSATLFALALLTRETVFPFALAGTAWIALERRAWRPALGYFAAAFAPLALLKLVIAAVARHGAQQGITLVPFSGLLHYRPFDAQHHLILYAVFIPALIAAGGALLLARRAPVEAALAVVTTLLYVVFLRKNDYVDWGAAGRDAAPVVLATLFCLGPRLRRAPFLAALILWSLPAFLLVAGHFGLQGLTLMTT
jgi:hypothetical protein